jgi:hypothetical protein
MTMIQPINVTKLLNELFVAEVSGKKLSDRKIGEAVSTTGATICRLRKGIAKGTNSDLAIAIANYHAQVFGQK